MTVVLILQTFGIHRSIPGINISANSSKYIDQGTRHTAIPC